MTHLAEAFERWIRGPFVALNSALEAVYFARDDRGDIESVGGPLKARLRDEGHAYVVALWQEGNTGDGFASAFGVLGDVGMYLAALRRHELTNPARETRSPFPEASALALDAGTSIGMAPRFATAHLTTHNRAIAGLRKSFTTLADEFLFIDENTRAILCFQRAADALARIVPLGVTNPAADTLLAAAADALREAVAVNLRLFEQLDTDRFFWCVRPYYKPYRVGRQEFRGANAGDFAGINEIDLLLGLCRASDPYYAQLLADKMSFMLPADQARLRDTMRHRNLLDEFLAAAGSTAPTSLRPNARAFLDVCDLYAETARLHHDALVHRFITEPSRTLPENRMAGLTASGPPLHALLQALETLRDLRAAVPRDDIPSRAGDLARLRAAVR